MDSWSRRCKRVDINNLLVIGTENDLCSRDDVEKFMKLKYENKIFFTANDFNIKGAIFIKEMKRAGSVNGYDKAHILYKYWLNSRK